MFSEDSSETTVSTSSESNAHSICSNRCSSPGTNSFYAIKILKEASYRCKCIDLEFSSVVMEVSGAGSRQRLTDSLQSKDSASPLTDLDCPAATDDHKEAFAGDSGLMDFLTGTFLGLSTSEGQPSDAQERVNICNPDRTIDMATLYLAQALGLNTANIKDNFVYEASRTYLYPNSSSGPAQIFPPDTNLVSFPGLQQTYWTIVAQYTATSEPGLRSGRSAEWCWRLGKGLHDHCSVTTNTNTCQTNNCRNVWRNFVEACHRVRGLDTSLAQYRSCCNQNKPCGAQSQPGVTIYQLNRM